MFVLRELRSLIVCVVCLFVFVIVFVFVFVFVFWFVFVCLFVCLLGPWLLGGFVVMPAVCFVFSLLFLYFDLPSFMFLVRSCVCSVIGCISCIGFRSYVVVVGLCLLVSLCVYLFCNAV